MKIKKVLCLVITGAMLICGSAFVTNAQEVVDDVQ